MQDDDREAVEDAAAGADEADWVDAAGVSGEHVLAGERAPRLHRALMILGPIGLAIAIVLSLWSSSRQVERSVNIQVETTWAPGERLAVRTQIVGPDLKPIEPKTAVSLAVVDAQGQRRELAQLQPIAPGISQGAFEVPDLSPGEAELVVRFDPGPGVRLEAFEERLPISVVAQRERDAGRQVISEHMLQWADDTDEQPESVRIDVRPAGRLLAGFDNTVFVRVTDPVGEPWAPKPEGTPAQIQVLLVSGEFGGEVGTLDHQPILYEGPVDELGLARVSGVLSSDVVRFEVRLIGEAEIAQLAAKPEDGEGGEDGEAPPAADPPASPEAPPALAKPEGAPALYSGPKRRLRFVSHAGTVRIHASTNFAQPGDALSLTVDAISSRKPVFVDAHGPTGAWLDSFTPPLQVPQDREWTIPADVGASADGEAIMQFEAYQSTLRPEDSSSLARVQVVPAGTSKTAAVAGLIARQREQLSLPRVDKQFEIGRERAYLRAVEATLASLDEAGVERARAFLLGSLEAVVHGPPQSLNTRAREDEALAAFKRRWALGVRWFLLGGGTLFIVVMTAMVWRNQRKLEVQTTSALGLGALREGAPDSALPAEELAADQSLAIVGARRQILARGAFTIALMVAALLLTVAMLESLVWEY